MGFKQVLDLSSGTLCVITTNMCCNDIFLIYINVLIILLIVFVL